jgi:hypothetical protein
MRRRQIYWGVGAACNALVAQAVAYLDMETMTPLHWLILVATTAGAYALGAFAKADNVKES